jgi:hypothetical protein
LNSHRLHDCAFRWSWLPAGDLVLWADEAPTL